MMRKSIVATLTLVMGLLAGMGQGALADAIPNLSGDWAMNANNQGGTLTLQHEGNRLTGRILGVPLAEGAVLADGTVKFIRTGANQTFTGRFSLTPDGTGKLSGTFHCPITPPHTGFKWTATRRTTSTTATTGPRTTSTTATTGPRTTSTTATTGPRNLTAYRNRVGLTFQFQVTGSTSGSVWGTGDYSDDSDLSAAAVHAGVLRAGQSGVVTVVILPIPDSYKGSAANGVTSRNYPGWGGSYRFVKTAGAAVAGGRLEGKVLNPSTGVTVYVGTGFNSFLAVIGPMLEYHTMAAKVTPDREGSWVANVPAGTYDVYIISRGYVPLLVRDWLAPGRVDNISLERGSLGAHNNSLILRQSAR